jgi:biopolymer transport protein ExbB
MWQVFSQADALGQALGTLLLTMSVATWVVILWKSWLLHRGVRSLSRATAAFWLAPDLDEAERRLARADTAELALPLLQAARSLDALVPDCLVRQGERGAQLTRLLREALDGRRLRLEHGQTLLASVAATAPFVGLLGTVLGVQQALSAVALGEGFQIQRVAGPVGEALLMTAAGLAVALPALLGHNALGRHIARLEAELEGFAHDLREWFAAGARS